MRKRDEEATLVLEGPRRMMSEKQILGVLPIARWTLQNWIKARRFPQPVPIGENRKAWYADEVAWQKACESLKAA